MPGRPVLVLQHLSADGPATLASWLQRRGIAFEVFNSEAGHDFPARIDGYAALAVLGGEMSANDALPSLRQAEALILQAMAKHRPVIGHCLGGQLMARALGAKVVASTAPEIGWQAMSVHDTADARRWFGAAGVHTVFQWHYEAFELPVGAVPLAASAACPQEAFALGPHLAMQFHVELDAEKLGRWALDDGERYRHAQRAHATVQSGEAMLADAAAALPVQQRLADRLYGEWLRGVSE